MVVDSEDIERVGVIGAGNMGHGIAEVVALAGYDVVVRDVEEDLVEDGYDDISWSLDKLAEKGLIDREPADVLARIETTTDLATAAEGADLVVEAAPERLELKRDLFGQLDELAPEAAILASNTSSLSITEIAEATDRPEQVVGTHFFNPPVKMDLVEVIYGEETSDETAEAASEFVESIGKTPIYVRKDVQAFVVNSVLGPFMGEPFWMVSEGEATVRQADATMVHERGYPMGPFELADMNGLDVGYHVRKEAGIPIPPVLEEKVENDELGRKTGKGFYDYVDGEGERNGGRGGDGTEGGDGEGGHGEGGDGKAGAGEDGRDGAGADYAVDDAGDFDWLRVEAAMVNEAAKLVGDDVATPEAVDTGMRLGAGFPQGVCRRGDEIGLGVVLGKLRDLHAEHGRDRYEPADYLVELVEAGHTGEDAGRGFYEYDGGDGPGDYRSINWSLDDDGLLEIEIDRPHRLNALNRDVYDSIVDLLTSVDEDDVRMVTFEGAGDRAFSAGTDVGDFADISPAQKSEPTEVYQVVGEFPRPTLAKIDGYCLGGGLELALACDLRIATEGSEFGFPEINLGLIPGGGGTQRAIRMLGDARAKELVFRGEHVSAERAASWGLINRAVPADEFDDAVAEFVADIVHGAPIALRKAKRVINEGADQDFEAGLEMESQAFALLLTTEDFEEGSAAFAEDREPEFEGK